MENTIIETTVCENCGNEREVFKIFHESGNPEFIRSSCTVCGDTYEDEPMVGRGIYQYGGFGTIHVNDKFIPLVFTLINDQEETFCPHCNKKTLTWWQHNFSDEKEVILFEYELRQMCSDCNGIIAVKSLYSTLLKYNLESKLDYLLKDIDCVDESYYYFRKNKKWVRQDFDIGSFLKESQSNLDIPEDFEIPF